MTYCIIIPLIILVINLLALHLMIRNVQIKDKKKNTTLSLLKEFKACRRIQLIKEYLNGNMTINTATRIYEYI